MRQQATFGGSSPLVFCTMVGETSGLDRMYSSPAKVCMPRASTSCSRARRKASRRSPSRCILFRRGSAIAACFVTRMLGADGVVSLRSGYLNRTRARRRVNRKLRQRDFQDLIAQHASRHLNFSDLFDALADQALADG